MYKFKILFPFLFIFFTYSFSINAEESYVKINYGISQHGGSFTAKNGAPTSDDEGEGFILSAGTFIGSNWGADIMFYNLGETSIKGDKDDIFQVDGVGDRYIFTSGGTITNELTGYGIGIMGAAGLGQDLVSSSAKIGIHQWDKDGSTSLTQNNTAINSTFFDSGTDLYAGFGLNINVTETVAANVSFDVLGVADETSFGNSTSFISLGLTASF